MVFFRPFVISALLSGLVAAAPMPDGHSASSYEAAPAAPASYDSSWQAPPASSHESTYSPPAEQKWTPTPQQYGSGKSSWVDGEYDNCVQSCMAEYPSKPAEWKPTTTAGHGGATPTGAAGATHTVIVAPQQGVLRYIPFAVNASIGDVIHFKWGANNHTVTQGSALLPCNKSLDANAFTPSGLQQKDFEFTQVVNSTEPTYFYCAAPTHCQKGMFGIINPPTDSTKNVGSMLGDAVKVDQNMAAKWSWTKNQTTGNEKASKWGYSINYSALPEWSHKYVADNVMYTQVFLAKNPELQGDNGALDLAKKGDAPLLIPEDEISALNNAAAAAPVESASASGTPSASSAAPSSTGAAGDAAGALGDDSGAASLASPKALVAIVALVATFFAL